MAVHFWPALTVISVTSCCTYRSNSGVPGSASGPRIEQFSESASALNRTDRLHDRRMGPQLPRGRGGSGEGHQILLADRVEQAAGAAAHQLKRARGQQPGSDHQLHQPGGQVGGLGGRA